MKLSCEWRVFATKTLISLAILGQTIALAYLWLERMQTQSIPDDAPVCAPTKMLMEVLQELEAQGPIWKGDSVFNQDTVLFENKQTGQYYIVRGRFDGRSCVLDGGRAAHNSY